MLYNDIAVDDDDDDDAYDDDARTRHRRKRRRSATRRAPRIDVSEQTDDASRNEADDAAEVYCRLPAPSDACAVPEERSWDCTAESRR